MPTAEDESEYADYDVFLEDGFDPIAFANSLVVATNNATDTDVDLDAPKRRVQYSIEELDGQLNELAGANYVEILDQAGAAVEAKQRLAPVRAALDHANSSYAKLERDVVAPYESAQLHHAVLKKLHSTSVLLRALTWYLVLARQLARQLPPGRGSPSVAGGGESGTTLHQAADTLVELRHQIETHESLRSLSVVRAHENTLHGTEERIKSSALSIIRGFSMSSSTDGLRGAFQALDALNSSLVPTATLSYLKAQIAAASNNLSRALGGSIATFESAASDARGRAQCLVAMTEALGRATTTTGAAGDGKKSSLLGSVLVSLDIKSLVTDYWRDVASGLDARTRSTLLRNPSGKRSLQTNASRFTEIIRAAIISGGGVADSGPEIKVMVNAITSMAR